MPEEQGKRKSIFSNCQCNKHKISHKSDSHQGRAKAIYQALNPAFQKWSGESLAQALTKVPEANVQTKRTKGEQKRKRCEELRIAKEKIEGNWKETLLRHAHVSFILK